MFWGYERVPHHPCYNLDEVVVCFLEESVDNEAFSEDLFPQWFRETLKVSPKVEALFKMVHRQLHDSNISSRDQRVKIKLQHRRNNRIKRICTSDKYLPVKLVDWESPLGKPIKELMDYLYKKTLDSAIFNHCNSDNCPTKDFYSQFIKLNKRVCPFCGLDRHKNPLGPKRGDFDHYLKKSEYALTAVQFNNLIPMCSVCNQDYKLQKDIAYQGNSRVVAFYPYSNYSPMDIEITCICYPDVANYEDLGKWKIKISSSKRNLDDEISTWNRIFKIEERLEQHLCDYQNSWLDDLRIDYSEECCELKLFRRFILEYSQRFTSKISKRLEPDAIIKKAFYTFLAIHSEDEFLKSCLRWFNRENGFVDVA